MTKLLTGYEDYGKQLSKGLTAKLFAFSEIPGNTKFKIDPTSKDENLRQLRELKSCMLEEIDVILRSRSQTVENKCRLGMIPGKFFMNFRSVILRLIK